MLTETDPIIAILLSDVHLSLHPPLARSVEKNWPQVQARYFRQVEELLPSWEVPIVVAGDLFDRPAAPPELLNWCLAEMPRVYAVPGQHDLALHSLADLKKTSFWSLCLANKVEYIDPEFPIRLPVGNLTPGLVLHGFPWNVPLKPLNVEQQAERGAGNALHVAVVHRYLWTKTTGFVGAPENCRLARTREQLLSYKAAVFGDNHIPFLRGTSTGEGFQNGISILNSGCFIRRKADEKRLQPGVGLLHASGCIEHRLLDVSEDQWLDVPDTEQANSQLAGIEEFVEQLEQSSGETIDFPTAVKQYLERNKIGQRVRRQVLTALEAAAEG